MSSVAAQPAQPNPVNPPVQGFRSPWYPEPNPRGPMWPTFTAAHMHGKLQGNHATIQRVKNLEIQDSQSLDKGKKRRHIDEDEEVDIFGSDLEDNEENVYNDTMDFDDGFTDDMDVNQRYVQNQQQLHALTELTAPNAPKYGRNLVVARKNKNLCLVSNMSDTDDEWIIDSGASQHWTPYVNDFIEYHSIKPMPISTANGTAYALGKGTVILETKSHMVRISLVFHVPDINSRLLSLGKFHESGLHSRGSSKGISLYNEKNEETLAFYPRKDTDPICTLNARSTTEKAHPHTIYKVDFETLHQRLAHPSNEVLQKAFPKVEIPEKHICSGCAQGKMTNKSFPSDNKCASEPFKLIHSNLKLFPTESYRKYKYAIVFLDDYTSTAWTINLRTKDAALPATKQFIAMAETQYQA